MLAPRIKLGTDHLLAHKVMLRDDQSCRQEHVTGQRLRGARAVRRGDRERPIAYTFNAKNPIDLAVNASRRNSRRPKLGG